ncbi:MAG: DUF177 domain-containing protein [Flavobacteriia bacterium]|nr:DUF177 domain-containing protein [Flavobacteriia bacterium]
MAKKNKEYVIPFVGLKVGKHEFLFDINDSFFDDYEFSLIKKGQLKVKLFLEKKENMLVADFTMKGVVETICDCCNDVLSLPVKNTSKLIYTIGLEDFSDDNITVLHPDDFEIDVKYPIYELISLSLPSKKKHTKGFCNPEMIEIMRKYMVNFDDTNVEPGTFSEN